MAIANGDFSFSGKLGNVSAFKKHGSDKTILRTKGGASKQKIRTAKSFAATRAINTEWKAVTAMTRTFREAIHSVLHVADPDFTGNLNKLFKAIQVAADPDSRDKRPIQISSFPFLLEGLNVNQHRYFESVIRHPLAVTINREELSATVTILELVAGVNFKNPGKEPLYRLVFSFIAIADRVYQESTKTYQPCNKFPRMFAGHQTEWLSDKTGRPASVIELEMRPKQPITLQKNTNLVLLAAVEFGIPGIDGETKYVKYSGCGKVLAVG